MSIELHRNISWIPSVEFKFVFCSVLYEFLFTYSFASPSLLPIPPNDITQTHIHAHKGFSSIQRALSLFLSPSQACLFTIDILSLFTCTLFPHCILTNQIIQSPGLVWKGRPPSVLGLQRLRLFLSISLSLSITHTHTHTHTHTYTSIHSCDSYKSYCDRNKLLYL